MKVHIVTPANRGLYAAQMEEMHRQRRKVFVEDKGWSAIDRGGPLEIDEFDHSHAIYLLLLGDVGEILGSARLLPTWRDHLMKSKLARFIKRSELATGPGIWELSRWIGGPGLDRQHDARCRTLLLTAISEFAQSHCVEYFVACLETRLVNVLVEMNWPFTFLGEPDQYDEGEAVAVRWRIGTEEYEHTRRLLEVATPASIMASAWPSARIPPMAVSVIDALLDISSPDVLTSALEAVDLSIAAHAANRPLSDFTLLHEGGHA